VYVSVCVFVFVCACLVMWRVGLNLQCFRIST